MKKTLSIILAILMIVTTMPFAFAADDYAVVDTEAGTVTIDGTLGGKTTATEDDVNALVEKLKGYVDSGITTIIVTGSEPALHNFYDIDTSAVSAALYYLVDGRSDSPYCGTIDLILPDVTEIVDDEFNNTYALNSITLPKVTSVGDGAFYATIYLQKLTFGSVVTAIEQRSKVVFYYVGNKVGGCELILNCGQANEDSPYIPDFTANTWYDKNNKYFKSITLTHTGGEATCVAKAVCETCGVEYGDIAPDAHDIVIDKSVAPDCANTGLTQGEHCTRCDHKVEQEIVPALNHKDTLVQVDAKAPTCTEIGWEAYEYCTACTYTTYVEIPASHKIEKVDAKAPTCTEIGWDAYEYCSACNYTTYVEIPENGHTPLEAATENEVASKCGLAGSYDLVVYCACGEELDRDTVAVDALIHSFTKYVVTEEAKCGVAGKEVAACDHGCGATDEKAIDALTHTDADGDYICDHGCGYEYEKPAPEEPTPDTPDEPETPDEPTDDACDHLCHKDGFMGFIWKIVKFFSKLFKINPVCECGAAHY